MRRIMLTPIALATWISFCIPSADAAIATALVMAGSGGDPALITDATGQVHDASRLRQENPDTGDELYIGLTQIPASQLRARGIPLALALNHCNNLTLGWQLWSEAHAFAKTRQTTQWKAISLAFTWYRIRQDVLEIPFSKKAAELALAHQPVAPASVGSRLYSEVAASWANGQAQLLRLEFPGSHLDRSHALVRWARNSIE
jgi:hypothetical protein